MPLVVPLPQVNRHTLESHFLNRKAAQEDLVQVVDRLCGLNAQTARAPYISLWSRMRDFRHEQLDGALYAQRKLIRTWLVRGTVHIVSVKDFFHYRIALERTLVDGWVQQLRRRGLMLPAQRNNRLHQKVIAVLSQGPRTRKELLPELRGLLKDHSEAEQKMRLGWILRELSYRGLVCHGESTGAWYHFKEHRFETVDNWIQGQDVVAVDESDAQRLLLIKYLHGYGPASIGDFAYWAGLKMAAAREIFAGAEAELEEIHIEGQKDPLWILEEDAARLEDIEDSKPRPVRFLPEFDSLVMGHREKGRILDDVHHQKVFLRLADVAPVFLVDGRIAGVWNYKMTTGQIKIEPFHPLRSRDEQRVKAEAKRLKVFFQDGR